MKTKIMELRQQRAQLISEARQMLERTPGAIGAEDEQRYQKLLGDAQGLADQALRMEQMAALSEGLEESGPQHRRSAAGGSPGEAGEMRINERRDSAQYAASYDAFLRHGIREMGAAEYRALQMDADGAGGYLVAPTQMVATIVKAMDNLVFVRQRSGSIYPVTDAGGLGVPTLRNDIADADWTAEIKTGSEDSALNFGKRELKPYPLAKRLKMSRTLLRKAPNVSNLVAERMGYKFGITQEKGYLTGTGAGQPLGVFTPSVDGISTGRDVSTGNTTTAITFDGLIEAKYSLKAPYWRNAAWAFHRDAVKMLAKIKDLDGQYIWEASVQAGQPDRVLGLPMDVSEYVPNTFTTGLYVGILADWSYYWIVDGLNLELQRLEELYAETNQVGIVGRYEGDGMPVLEEAFVRVKLG